MILSKQPKLDDGPPLGCKQQQNKQGLDAGCTLESKAIQQSLIDLLMPKGPELAMIIVEYVNFGITLLFFVLFVIRAIRLNPIGTTNAHISKYPWVRVGLALAYVALSFFLLPYEYFVVKEYNTQVLKYFLEGGGGECINALILILHVFVLRQELRKQQSISRLHLVYSLYLSMLSIIRLLFSINALRLNKDKSKSGGLYVIMGVTAVLTAISLISLAFWVNKRHELPYFIKIKRVDNASISRDLSRHLISRDFLDSSRYTHRDHSTQIIYPTVMVERGLIRVILEAYASNNILQNEQLEQTRTNSKRESKDKMGSTRQIQSMRAKTSQAQHLEIVSNVLYTPEELRAIYLQCSRFNIKTTLDFDPSIPLSVFYPQVKNYMEELFSIKKCYTPEILSLFDIPKDNIDELAEKISLTVTSMDELSVSSFIDNAALFVSVDIFKHMWVQDHFIFYMSLHSMDFKDQAVTYKRYSNFEQLHDRLLEIMESRHRADFKLPKLPKKHLFGMQNSAKVKQRRHDLSIFLRVVANDYELMMKVPEARELILNFLQLKKTLSIVPNEQRHKQFYEGLEIRKTRFSKKLTGDQYVTFYEFEIFRNGILTHLIKKRFSEFVQMHEELERWMGNMQIVYKFVVLPEKHLYKSQAHRHESLCSYLNNIVSIADVHHIYAVGAFLALGQRDMSDNSGMSMVESPTRKIAAPIKKLQHKVSIQEEAQNSLSQSSEKWEKQQKNLESPEYDSSRLSSLKHMSLLIDELGDSENGE